MRNFVWVLAFLAIVSCPAAADVVNFSNISGTQIRFTGDGTSAEFTMTTVVKDGHNAGFQITDTTLAGLYGAIAGTYQYQDSDIVVSGPTQTATVTRKSAANTNTFTIWDALGTPFTATVNWISIFTAGTAGALNNGATVNLTNFAYAGTNAALQHLAAAPDGTLTATFQFVPGVSLQGLESGTHGTSYSGSLTVPDGGMTLMLLGGALVAVESLRRKLRA